MDKYEYNLKVDQIKSLLADENYEAAADVADSINWNKIRNVNALVKAAEAYDKVERYTDSRELLLLAYDRSPIGRMIIYKLAEVSIKLGDYSEAEEYYKEFVEIAPHDNLKYILKYSIRKNQGASYEEIIPILEEFKDQEYTEEWAYELAYMYHKAGDIEKCIDACDELILWFGDGPYVERALELKMLYQPLTKLQEEKYRKFRLERDGMTVISGADMANGGEEAREPVVIPQIEINQEKFNTVNLQEEIAKGMQQIMEATEKETVSDTMDSIKKIVEEIPYLQLPREETTVKADTGHIATDEEIDGALKSTFKEMLDEETDGQISLVVEETPEDEKQITGQMSIQDVLDEWEKTKRAAEAALLEAEQQKLESAKARALIEAEDLMERLSGVIPKLDAGVTPKELLEEEYMQEVSDEDITVEPVDENSEEILEGMGAEPDNSATDIPAEEIPEEVPYKGSDESAVEEDEEESEGSEEGEEIEDIEEIKDLEESDSDEIEELLKEPAEPLNLEIPDFMKSPVFGATAMAETATEEAGVEEISLVKPADDISEILIDTEETAIPDVVETVEVSVAPEKEPVSDEIPEVKEEIEDSVISGETIVLPTISLPDDVEVAEELKEPEINAGVALGETRRIPEIKIPAEPVEPVGKPESEKPEEPVKKAEPVKHVAPVTEPAEEKTVKTKPNKKLTEEQKELFSAFLPVNGMEEQISAAITNVSTSLSNSATTGAATLLITGERGCGKTVLAKNIIKALQLDGNHPNGKVGKVDASSLNKKEPQQLLKKVAGGCLIIEKAGELSKQSAIALGLLMANDRNGTLIVLEDTSKGIKEALSLDDGFANLFSAKVSIPIFTNDELVAFARAYANELGYAIDEMAILALYNRISNIQRLDQATTLTEIKDIVDEAIDKEAHGGLKKAFSILTAARYTDDDRIVLNERHFEDK